MNQQPLELYDGDCIGGYSLKVLNRSYVGPLIKVLRTGENQAEALIYPDPVGKLTLSSPVEIVSGNSLASNLGSFLCQSGYTLDPVFTSGTPSVTALATVFFDQSSGASNLTAVEATAPVLCSNGSLFTSDWGISLNMDGGKKFTGTSLSESFTIHYRAEFDSTSASKYLIRQSGDALYAKVTNLYLDEVVGADDVTVFVNEDYYSNYITQNVTIPASAGQLITLEVEVSENTLLSPPLYTLEDIDLLHTALIYSGVKQHVRRHTTNQALSEDIPSLQEKLLKFSPQSFYNLFYGAKAIFGMFSFAGLLVEGPVTLIRAKVIYGNFGQYLTADILANNSGYINLNSPVQNITGGPASVSSISILGELVGNPSYGDPANLGHNDAFIERWYSQAIQYPGIYATPQAIGNEPKFYDSATSSLEVSTDDGICGLSFVSRTGQTDSYLNINEPIDAKSIITVYQNNDINSGISGITGGTPTQCVSLFSKNHFPSFNDQVFQDGVGVFSTNAVGSGIIPYVGSLLGKDTDVNVIGMYLGDGSKKVVFNEQEIDITGIDDTPTQASPNGMKFKQVGGAEGFNLDGRLFAAIYYDDDRYAQEQEMQDYMNILFRSQNNPISTPKLNPYIADYSYGKPSNSPASTNPFQFNVNLMNTASYASGNRVEQNDLLLVAVFYDAKTAGATNPGTEPSGWTKFLDISTTPDTDMGGSIYYKVADGTETNTSNTVQFEINNPNGDISDCIWFSYRIKKSATSGTIIESSTPQAVNNSDTITALGISKTSGSSKLAFSFAVADNGLVQAGALNGTGWGYNQRVYTTLNESGIVSRWAFKDVNPGETSSENAVWTMNKVNDPNIDDRIALQLLVSESSAGGSPPPVGLDNTWSFDTDIENWAAVNNGSVSYQASYTPSSDTEKTGILVLERTNNSLTSTLAFDLSALTGYNSSSTLYYEMVYSIPSVNPNGVTYTGLNQVTYGQGGNYDDYTNINSQTFNTWITVNGDLNPGGTNDTLYINWDPFTFTYVAGAKVFIDRIRVSHTDFR